MGAGAGKLPPFHAERGRIISCPAARESCSAGGGGQKLAGFISHSDRTISARRSFMAVEKLRILVSGYGEPEQGSVPTSAWRKQLTR